MAKQCGKATFDAVDQIRAEFQTSRTATALRMIDYDPEPALLVCHGPNGRRWFKRGPAIPDRWFPRDEIDRSEEHTSELQSLMRISYAVFCLKKKNKRLKNTEHINSTIEL